CAANATNVFVVKYDANGNSLWAKGSGGNGTDIGEAICTDLAGNIYCTGFFHSDSIHFGSAVLISSSDDNAFIVKFSSSGNTLWAKKSVQAANGQAIGYGICADQWENIYIAGYYHLASVALDTTTLLLNGTYNTFLVSCDSAGHIQWGRRSVAGTINYARCVNADAYGDIYMCGMCGDTIVGFGNQTAQITNNYDPMYITKFDTSGNTICLNMLTGGGDDASSICSDQYGNAYVTGDFFPPSMIVGNDTLLASSLERVFLAQYNCSVDAGVNEASDAVNAVSIYPDPAKDHFILEFQEAHNDTYTLEIYNSFGEMVLKISGIVSGVNMDTDNMNPGIYFCRITSNGRIAGEKKLIITH
ncbi:MAG TPA: T9SS type A sorting domain-containing protein, partial [Bacteroidia bacterium]|nr:T9SS type A sorting domain-containing protein [Bacteroidia bacterium]